MTEYSIWVLEYSNLPDYARSGVIYGAHNQGTVNLPYSYVVIQGGGRTVMVDVGFRYSDYGKVLADRFGAVNWKSPRTVLAEIGIAPEDVDTVLVTHAHFDHFGNVADFPNARFFIQEEEFSKWLWALTLPQQFDWLQLATDPGDVLRAAQLAADGRLTLVNGDAEDILPGISLFAAPDTHTFGSQFVQVKNGSDENSFILAGDLVYVFENVSGIDGDGAYVPVGLASGSQLNLLLATDRMMQLVDGEARRIVPVHEDRLGASFPSRISAEGFSIIEITLAGGQASLV